MLISQREAIAQMAGEGLALADGSQLSDAEVCVLVNILEWIARIRCGSYKLEWIARIRCGSYKRDRRAGAPSGRPVADRLRWMRLVRHGLRGSGRSLCIRLFSTLQLVLPG